MSSRGPYRRHTPEFKRQLCQEIRSGALGRRDAQRKYSLSANLLQIWLTQYDRGELDSDEVEAGLVARYEAQIAALERKVGQLTMELDLLKKTPSLRLMTGSGSVISSIVSGPRLLHPTGVPRDRDAAEYLLLPSCQQP